MKDIARRAGVTAATVSMSLRNHPAIPATTRDRISAIAREMGYKPNPYVSALMRSRRRGRPLTTAPVLAFVCLLEKADAWRNSPSLMRRAIFAGAVERAAALGYDGQEFWLHRDGISPERFSTVLHARGIQGVLLGPPPDDTLPPNLKWELFSTVTLSVPHKSTPVHAVCNDHYFSSLRAVYECCQLGYRRPGLVLRSGHRELFQGRWEAGYFTAQRTLPGLEPLEPLFLEDVETPGLFSVEEFHAWFKRERPDVIITMASNLLIEEVLLDLGFRIPEDIGLVGLSCPEIGHRLSGICQQGRKIGATAVDVLISMVERGERGLPDQAVTTMVESVWNPGRTVRPQNSAAASADRLRTGIL